MDGLFIVWLDSGDPVAENVSKAEAEAIALYWQEKGYPTTIETVEESNKRHGEYLVGCYEAQIASMWQAGGSE